MVIPPAAPLRYHCANVLTKTSFSLYTQGFPPNQSCTEYLLVLSSQKLPHQMLKSPQLAFLSVEVQQLSIKLLLTLKLPTLSH